MLRKTVAALHLPHDGVNPATAWHDHDLRKGRAYPVHDTGISSQQRHYHIRCPDPNVAVYKTYKKITGQQCNDTSRQQTAQVKPIKLKERKRQDIEQLPPQHPAPGIHVPAHDEIVIAAVMNVIVIHDIAFHHERIIKRNRIGRKGSCIEVHLHQEQNKSTEHGHTESPVACEEE